MTIKIKSLLVVTIVLVLLVVLLATLFSLSTVRSQLAEAENHRYRAARVADRLRQSSDDLTRMARTFAVTNNPVYEKYFYRILDIRNGKVPRPEGYDGVFWDIVTATGELPDSETEAISLNALLEALNLTKSEKAKLIEAERQSNDLVSLEVTAFNAIKGLFKDKEGAFTIRRQPDLQLARSLTHGKAYHQAKRKIMQPIGMFMAELNARTRNTSEQLSSSSQIHITILVVVVVMIFLFTAYASYRLVLGVISPVEGMAVVAGQIRRGNLLQRAVAVKSEDEIGILIKAFNQMLDENQSAIRQLEAKTEEAVHLEKLAREASEKVTETNSMLESRVHKRTEQLRTSEEQLKAIINNAFAVIYMKDEKGQYTMVNDRFRQLFRLEDNHIIGLNDYDIFPTEFARIYRKNDREVFQFGLPVEREEVALIGDTEYTFISVKFPMRDAAGTIIAVCGISTDITQMKQVEIDRAKLQSQLQHAQKMDAVGQLTGGIAHDFNNILNIVYGNLELLKRRVSTDDKAMDRLEKAIRGTLRGADITKKLLNFSRKDAHEIQLIQVNEFILNLEDLIAKSLTAKITVDTHLATNLWPTAVDPGDFEDALLNLCINSRDAMPEGGTLIIETVNKKLDENYVERNPGSETGEFVMISVSDTGVGFTDEGKEKAFEPFFTTKEPGKGTGLGLSMVYGFVRRSGGHLTIYSEVGKGSTLRFYLPRVHVKEKTPVAAHIEELDLPVGTEKILVVDDEEGLLDVAVSYLEELGYTVYPALSGGEALAILKAIKDLDLLFSDVIMTGDMDGYQVALAAHEENPDLKVLLASGFTKKREEYVNGESTYLAALAANLLTKPYNQSELAQAVRRVLDADRLEE